MKKTIVTSIKVLIITLVIVWVIIILVDYFKSIDGDNPLFCIKEETKIYDDGTVYSCIGLGYKLYRYERKSISAVEFGPFFIQERND